MYTKALISYSIIIEETVHIAVPSSGSPNSGGARGASKKQHVNLFIKFKNTLIQHSCNTRHEQK